MFLLPVRAVLRIEWSHELHYRYQECVLRLGGRTNKNFPSESGGGRWNWFEQEESPKRLGALGGVDVRDLWDRTKQRSA